MFRRHRIEKKIEKYIPQLRRYSRALCGNTGEADDLVQDCLLRALEKSAQWKEGSDLRAWLFTLLHNIHVDKLRSRNRQPLTVELQDVIISTPHNQTGNLHLNEIDLFLQYLSRDHREVLLLVGLEGLTYDEVARILDLPKGTVMSRLSRARDHLRQLMNGEKPKTLKRVK